MGRLMAAGGIITIGIIIFPYWKELIDQVYTQFGLIMVMGTIETLFYELLPLVMLAAIIYAGIAHFINKGKVE